MELPKRCRIYWLDLARAVAILMVMMIHANEFSSYLAVLKAGQRVSVPFWVFQTCIEIICRMAVSLFILISGFLILNKKISSAKIFFKKSLIPLLITTEIWICINAVFSGWFYKKIPSLQNFMAQILFLKQSLPHMWFMPLIMGLYFSVPILIRLKGALSRQYIIAILGITYFYTSIIPTINLFFTINRKQPLGLTSLVFLGFLGGTYGIYFISGYLISKNFLKHLPVRCLIIICSLCAATLFFLQYQVYFDGRSKMGNYLLTGSQAFNVPMAICAFELLHRFGDRAQVLHKIVNPIASASFGIYLVHYPIMLILQRIFEKIAVFHNSNSFMMVTLFIMTFIISFLIVQALSRIPIANRLLLNKK